MIHVKPTMGKVNIKGCHNFDEEKIRSYVRAKNHRDSILYGVPF